METTTKTTMTRENIIAALYRWIAQRPGLEFGNYGDVKAYRAEVRSIAKDLREARYMLAVVERGSISADALVQACRDAYSGRLTLTPSGEDGKGCQVSYCAGQYWPTEYRRAVCAVLASALWYYWREGMVQGSPGSASIGDRIRRNARLTFGRTIAQRWFN